MKVAVDRVLRNSKVSLAVHEAWGVLEIESVIEAKSKALLEKFGFKTLRSRRFQRAFHGFNLQRPT
jgi:hypothetical protein